MANLIMDEAWHVKSYSDISTRLKLAGPVQLEMTYSDLIASVSIGSSLYISMLFFISYYHIATCIVNYIILLIFR